MKKKFEDNVASEMPKTKPGEPSLPWKIEEADLEKIDSENRDYRDLTHGEPPFKTRPLFLVLLIVAVFAAASLIMTGVITENDRIKVGISEKEKEAALLQVDLEKTALEKASLEKSSAELEKRVKDLAAQKELFTAVLESLTKKGDSLPVETQTPVLSQAASAENQEKAQ